jgi:uncharacterized membrane protein
MAASARRLRSDSHKRLVLLACILGSTVVTIDSTVVNVALPAIRADLGGGFAGQQWTANAYLVTLASLILIGGSFGDIFGERRVFTLGVGGFGATSLLGALAPTIELLVIARALQGVSGALLTPAALAVIVATFPREQRGRGRLVDGVGSGRGPARPADRRAARGRRLLALDLRHQPARRRDRAGADRPRHPGRPGRGRRRSTCVGAAPAQPASRR